MNKGRGIIKLFPSFQLQPSKETHIK